ncbi:MAG: hypothetical protein C0608_02710 [Deltaproteobacteria bacterium]|nr:MAG: hypothetical protein C0608_02710 [Deltaproteobacteria bacterium]
MKFRPKSLNDTRDPLKGNVNISPEHPLKELLLLTSGIAATIFIIYLLLGVAVDLVVPHISKELEQSIAARMEFPVVEDKRTPYLEELTDELRRSAPLDPGPIVVGVYPSAMANAFALPGGRMLITEGFLDEVESENELAMVISHELGHIAHRDPLRVMGRSLVLAFISSLFVNTDDSAGAFINSSMTLTQLGYSRNIEERCDHFALETISRHYGHGGGAVDFFKRMKDSHTGGSVPQFLSTHPGDERRISYLERQIDEERLGWGELTPLPEGWVNQDDE